MDLFTEAMSKARSSLDKKEFTTVILELEKLSNLGLVLTEEQEEDVNYQEGLTFEGLAAIAATEDVRFTFSLASLTCFIKIKSYPLIAAKKLLELGGFGSSDLFYKKAVGKAKKSLHLLDSPEYSHLDDLEEGKMEMRHVIETALSKIEAFSKAFSLFDIDDHVVAPPERYQGNDGEKEFVRRLWVRSDDELKRRLMIVNIANLKEFVKDTYGRVDSLDTVLNLVQKRQKWVLFLCRSCNDMKFSSADELKSHLQEAHGAVFEPCFFPDKISKDWARMISVEPWEPVNAVAAVGMINTTSNIVAYKDGWCRDWPLADDEERKKLLKDIRSLLVSFIERKLLSCSVPEYLIGFVVKPLEKLGLSKQTLAASRLLETPQSICFLDCAQLNQMLDFLRNITRKRDYGTVLVRRAVDSLWQRSRVKEKMDFDPKGAFLLLDKRLLQHGKVEEFDDEGRIRFFDPTAHYAQVRARGDHMFTWLNELYAGDEDGFEFPKPIREHNYDIWVAVLRAVEFTCRSLRTKHARKQNLMEYGAALDQQNKEEEGDAKKLQFLCDVAALDTKILLTDLSRIELVKQLTRLGFMDCRFYIETPVKRYVMNLLERELEP